MKIIDANTGEAAELFRNSFGNILDSPANWADSAVKVKDGGMIPEWSKMPEDESVIIQNSPIGDVYNCIQLPSTESQTLRIPPVWYGAR
jgi:hypothetical protein